MNVPLAIVGIGCLFPKANNLGAYWSLLKEGRDAITPVPPTHWNPDDYFDTDPKKPDVTYARRGGFLEPFPFAPGEFGIAPNDLEATDTAQLLGLVAAQMALRDAGYGPERAFDRTKVSVILGVTGTLELVVPLGARLGHPHWRRAMRDAGVPESVIDDAVKRIGESYVGWQENSFPGLLGNVVAGRIANRLDLHGTNCVVDAACASSLSAMHLAGLELAAGRSDVVVTGGVDTFNDIFMYMCFSKTPALSPTGDARPFAAKGDGTILGEGLGLIVLKRLADAERDGDRIYAVIRGLGTSSDGKGNAIYAPSAEGQQRCLNDAYRQAGVSPATVELVEAHGTGTKVGDATEIKGLTEVFGAAASAKTWCALGSVKSQIGHTKAAAGAAGLIKAALALYHKVLPPTAKVEQPAEAIAPGKTPFYVNTIKRPWLPQAAHPRRAGVSAFGFGGSNFHAVLEEYRPEAPGIDWSGDIQIAAIASDSVDGLRSQLAGWDGADWDAISQRSAESRATFRHDSGQRLLMVFTKEGPEPSRVIAAARTLLDRPLTEAFSVAPEGAYLGRGPAAGKLGVLFPGQGSQYVGMLRDLACQFPAMLDVLAEADAAFAQRDDTNSHLRLSDMIYPHPAFDPATAASQEQTLRATHVAQPAIGAISLGAMRVLDGFGVRPNAAAGHSYGELTALCAAGCYDTPALHSLSRLRGRLMAEVREGDPGSMLAVHAPVALIEQAIREERLDLVIANRNAPMQSVLSGPTREIERAAKALAARQLRSTRLPVAAAFHSRLIARAEPPFREALEGIRIQAAAVPVFSNSSGQPYPVDPAAIRELLAGQLARPVNFVQEIVSMIRAGVRTFLEVGPGSVLTRLVESTVREHAAGDGVDAFALDASNGKRSGIVDLAHALARLAARGHSVDLTVWERTPPHPAPRRTTDRPTLTVPICGANYIKPRAKRPPESAPPVAKSPPRPAVAVAPAPTPAIRSSSPPPAPLPPPVPVASVPSTKVSSPHRIAPVSVPPTPPGNALAHALQLTQEGLGVFQRIQEQTAQLHRQFLQNQETAQLSLQRLIEQQQQLLLASIGQAPIPTISVIPSPPPTPQPLPRPVPVAAPTPSALPTPAPVSPPVVAPRPIVTPPMAAVPTPSPAFAAPASTGSRDRVQRVLLDVVAEKTGYPAEMLNPDMGLDADLGIDSIKRVEILSALQERLPEAPAVKPEHLGTLNTLGQIVDFLAASSSPAVAPVVTSATVSSAAPASTDNRDRVQRVLLDVVAEKTGYPAEMLNPDMGLDADLGIDSIKRVEILSALQERLPEAPAVKPEHLGTLNTLGQIVDFLTNGSAPTAAPAPPPADDPAPARTSRQTLRSAPVPFDSDRLAITLPPGATIVLVAGADMLADLLEQHVRARGFTVARRFWDSPIEVPSQAAGLVLVAPPETALSTLHRGFEWLRAGGPALRNAGTALFATVSRLDGAFGLTAIPAQGALSGGLAGFAKTAHHEWPEVHCKAIDVPAGPVDEQLAGRIVHEVFTQGPLEVGVTSAGASTLELINRSRPALDRGLLGPDDVVVISGGARGVTAAAALAFAEQYQPTLVLLGRSPLPEEEPDWLRELNDEREIKRALATRANGSANPREIARRYQELAAGREVRDNLRRLQSAGARVAYRSVDVRDAAAVDRVLASVRAEFGPITGLIHGAGVIEDRRILDKTDAQFDRVVGTKVEGLLNLLAATSSDPLKVLAMFSSSTGRFGRTGQVDYAVANEVLNKVARQEAARRPTCRVTAINWGPWEGGMVTPDLARLFESEGVGLIPLRDGARFLIDELSATDRPVEVVAGVWLSAPTPPAPEPEPESPAPDGELHQVWVRTVDLASHPVLSSHVIDGRAVVPLALIMEWLAHAAMHGNPGLAFHGIDGARVFQGIKIAPDESRTVTAFAGKAMKRGGTFVVPVELRGERGDGRPMIHTRGEVLLVNSLPSAEPELAPVAPASNAPTAEDVYERTLFHGDLLRAIRVIEAINPTGIAADVTTAPSPAQWLTMPLRQHWLADPLAIDAAFQLLIVWGVEQLGMPNLPAAFAGYRQFRRSFPDDAVRVVARITPGSGPIIRADIEWSDPDGRVIAQLKGGEFVGDARLTSAFRRNRLATAAV